VGTAGPQPGTFRAQWATDGPQRPDGMPEYMPERLPEYMPDRLPEYVPMLGWGSPEVK